MNTLCIEEHINETALNWIKVTRGIKEKHWLGELLRVVFDCFPFLMNISVKQIFRINFVSKNILFIIAI